MARGWSRRLFFVLLSYACKEVLKIDWKLVEEEDAMEGRGEGGKMKLFVGGIQTELETTHPNSQSDKTPSRHTNITIASTRIMSSLSPITHHA